MKHEIHVVQKGDSWVAKKPDAARVSFKTETQEQSIKLATKLAKTEGLEVIIHGRNSKIRERNSYGNDPFPPRG